MKNEIPSWTVGNVVLVKRYRGFNVNAPVDVTKRVSQYVRQKPAPSSSCLDGIVFVVSRRVLEVDVSLFHQIKWTGDIKKTILFK